MNDHNDISVVVEIFKLQNIFGVKKTAINAKFTLKMNKFIK